MKGSRAPRRTAAPPDLRTRRLRLAEVGTTRTRGSRVRVAVTLEHDGERFEGTASDIGLEAVELRLAALAMLDAIHQAMDDSRFRLVGIKKVRAFDAEVILAVLTEGPDSGKRYVGAVPVTESAVRSAAAAVLHALNRALGADAEGFPV